MTQSAEEMCRQVVVFFSPKTPRIEGSAPKSQGLEEYRRESRDLHPGTSPRNSRNDEVIWRAKNSE